MKLMALIILYNPDSNALNNVKRLVESKYYNLVYVLDNSNNDNLIKEDNHVIYKCYHKNMGIAYALKDGLNYSLVNNYDYCLTLDQDSIFPFEKMGDILPHLEKHLCLNTGIVALNYNDKYKSKKDEMYLKMIITSGNFINIKNYKEIDGFNEELFIDYVDYDLCRQFYYKKKKIVVLTNISIKQKIGNPIYKRILFFKLKSMNASTIRYYYRFRNLLYCYKNNKKFFFKNLIKENITILIMRLVEDNKKEKLQMIKKGKKDGKKGLLGPFVDNHD